MSRQPSPDRLYELLPLVLRRRDVDQGEPLRALLGIIGEQVDVVEADVEQLYANWFVETCQDWVLPYIADLLGYRPVDRAAESGSAIGAETLALIRATYPRRDVAGTIANRRRRGTLSILEQLAAAVAGWPARAVELYARLDLIQATRHARLDRGGTVDLRRGDALDRIDGPFDELAHAVAVGRIGSPRGRRLHNIPSVGLFVWRLRPYSVTRAPAYCIDRDENRYTFSVLANDAPLITRPIEEPTPSHIADESNVPAWIRRRAFDERMADYYGQDKSLQIWRDDLERPVPLHEIVAADLSGWGYVPRRGEVAVDPVLGRIAFSPRSAPREGVWVTYHYGFSADMGGGEYERPLAATAGFEPDDGGEAAARPDGAPSGRRLYRVGDRARGGVFETLDAALRRWWAHKPADAIVEIVDSGAYVERDPRIRLEAGQRLELRAASGTRPTLRLLDQHTNRLDALRIERLSGRSEQPDDADAGSEPEGEPAGPADAPAAGPRVRIDGLLIAGRGLELEGELDEVELRHCTLVPGWNIGPDGRPEHGSQPSIELRNCPASVRIGASICGTIRVVADQVRSEPAPIVVEDSILDAGDPDERALTGPDREYAHARLTLRRSTVFGQLRADSLALVENAIVTGSVRVVRRQVGCVRYSYLGPDSRTPRRHRCQPDLARAAVEERFRAGELSEPERASQLERETRRVRPAFTSSRYGTPGYAQLAEGCAEEISRGAEDEASPGAFHDLFEPQRRANLETRLDEYTPASTDVAIIFVT
jgi:hypothetical protein